jgi:hypothetical protein
MPLQHFEVALIPKLLQRFRAPLRCAAPQKVPEVVPPHIYHEFVRLGCLGTAGSNAKKEFNLTDGDLGRIPHVEKSRQAHLVRGGSSGPCPLCRDLCLSAMDGAGVRNEAEFRW